MVAYFLARGGVGLFPRIGTTYGQCDQLLVELAIILIWAV
jgi:hypothetical protein